MILTLIAVLSVGCAAALVYVHRSRASESISDQLLDFGIDCLPDVHKPNEGYIPNDSFSTDCVSSPDSSVREHSSVGGGH